MNYNRVKWGIIGCGNVTEVKSGPAFNKVPQSELVAVMRRDESLARDYAERHGVPKWYTKAEDLINDPDINAIYIATPPDAHLHYTKLAFEAGKPVYVEKPMGRNFAECEEMIRLGHHYNLPLFVAYYRRTLPYFVKLKELIDQKVIGEVRSVHINLHFPPYDEEVGPDAKPRWRVDPSISGGGHFHDLASHQFDFLEYVFGPIAKATGYSVNQAGLYQADDAVVASFLFESGIVGSGNWCYTVNKEQRIDQAEIIGSKGKITFHFFEKFTILVETVEQTNEFFVPYPTHVQQALIETIVQELTGRDGVCPSTGTSGARANLILDWIVGPQKVVK